MKAKYVIYISAAFVVAVLILRNPAPYKLAVDKFVLWFSRTFSAFGRV